MSFRAISRAAQPLRDALELIRYGRKELRVSALFSDPAGHVNTSNFLFRLHSHVTVIMLLIGTSLVTLKLFGDPVDCLAHPGALTKEALQRFCWMEGAFSLHAPEVPQAYPGVIAGGMSPHSQPKHTKRVNHRYYQWVYFVLILQALMFYAPKHLWRVREANRIRSLIVNLRHAPLSRLDKPVQKLLLQELFDGMLLGDHLQYHFLVCELLYLLNLLGQFWFTDVFLGGAFRNLGWRWFVYANQQLDSSYDPLVKVFPRLVKCNFHYYGISGSLVLQDALCFLPINIINEKIYVILWMWFMFLFILTAGYFAFHLLLVISPSVRYAKLRFHAPSCNGRQLRQMVRSRGHWFVLEFVAINLKPNYCKELLNSLFDEFFDNHGRPKVEQSMLNKYPELMLNVPKQSHNAYIGHSMKNANNMANRTRMQMHNTSMLPEAPSGLKCPPSSQLEGIAMAFGGVKGSAMGNNSNLNSSFRQKSKKTTKARPIGFNTTTGNTLKQLLQGHHDDEWPDNVNETSDLLQSNGVGRRSPDSWQLRLNDNDDWPSKPAKNRRNNSTDDQIDMSEFAFLMDDRRSESQPEVEALLNKKKSLRSMLSKGKQKHLQRTTSDIRLDDD